MGAVSGAGTPVGQCAGRCPWCGNPTSGSVDRCPRCARLLEPWLPPGSLVAGRYEVEGALGSGGMGIVYRARDRLLDEVLALKVLGLGIPDPGLADRLRQEIKLARRVSHDNVCRIHDYGEHGRIHYISMELVEGLDLKRGLLAHGPPRVDDAFGVALQLAAGLEAIHRAGIVHRDLKSANAMRDRGGVVKLMDFGIAKAIGSPPAGLTLHGQIVGSPEYMSPEQARGEALDLRSDLYSLGVVLFELFTGHLPFQGDSPLSTVMKHLNEPPPLDEETGRRLPPALVPVLRTALAKSPEDRYPSAASLARALQEAARGAAGSTPTVTCAVRTPAGVATSRLPVIPPPAVVHRRPWIRWVTGAGALALLGGWLALHGRPAPTGTPAGPDPPMATRVDAPTPTPAGHGAVVAPGALRTPARVPRLTAPTPVPEAVSTPAPAVSEREPILEVPIGTALAIRIATELRSDRTRPGSTFEARLDEPLLSAGRSVAAEGALVTGRVLRAGRSDDAAKRPFLELGLSTIEIGGRPVPIRTGLYRLVAPSSASEGGPTLTAIVIGAAAGGLVGAAAGGRPGAVTGAAAGATAGAALGVSPWGPAGEYRVGNRLTFKLAESLPLEDDTQWRKP